jgi:surface protein
VVLLSLGSVASQQTACFPANGNAALRAAVADYVAKGRKSAAAQKYGADIGKWCVSRVTSFAAVFKDQKTFNRPLKWNTSSATNFAQFFQNAASFNQNLGNLDTSRVTNMDRAFFGAKKFQGKGLNRWNTNRVQSLYYAFRNSSMNADLSNWTMSSATDLRETFRFTPMDKDLCAWGNTLKPTKIGTRVSNMFATSNCPIKTSPSLATSPIGPLCHACPVPWRWGTECFPTHGELYDAVGVSMDSLLFPNRSRT